MAIAGALETDALASVLFARYLGALGISAYARGARIAPLDEPDARGQASADWRQA